MTGQIRYCTSADGTRIAYSTDGAQRSGHTAIILGGWMVPREIASSPRFGRRSALPPQWREINLERRGIGASQRDVSDFSLDAQIADVIAAQDASGDSVVDIVGFGDAGAVLGAFAARYPERVRRFVWNQAFVRGRDTQTREGAEAFKTLIRDNWGLARRTLASMGPPLSAENARWYADALKKLMSPVTAAAYLDFASNVDLTDVLPHIAAPTLIVHPTDMMGYGSRSAHEVAALIPDSQLLTLDTSTGDTSASRHMSGYDFLLGGEQPGAPALPDTALHTILFTDIESSTEQTQRLGDAAGHDIVRRHDAIVRASLAAHGGREIKHTGDGIMASFPTASLAAECALAIQREARADAVRSPRIRIGLNAGEPVAEGNDLFGTAVQLARRVCDAAEPGTVLCTNVVRELCAGKPIAFDDAGELMLKGFAEPVRLYAARAP